MKRHINATELEFLLQHGFTEEDAVDGNGLGKSYYRPIAKELDVIFAYNAKPCPKAGHTLFTRSGHCAMCSTHHIGFYKNATKSNIIYLVYSSTMDIHKIGITKKFYQTGGGRGSDRGRINTLNETAYGGANDWEPIEVVKTSHASRLEDELDGILNQYKVTLPYNNGGITHETTETYKCESKLIHSIFKSVIAKKQ